MPAHCNRRIPALICSSIVCSAGIFHDKIFYELLSCMFSLSPSKTISQEGDRMKEPSKNKSADTDWEIDIQSCSATDCTGLIPALPESDAELEHYQDLYHYLPDEKK